MKHFVNSCLTLHKKWLCAIPNMFSIHQIRSVWLQPFVFIKDVQDNRIDVQHYRHNCNQEVCVQKPFPLVMCWRYQLKYYWLESSLCNSLRPHSENIKQAVLQKITVSGSQIKPGLHLWLFDSSSKDYTVYLNKGTITFCD